MLKHLRLHYRWRYVTIKSNNSSLVNLGEYNLKRLRIAAFVLLPTILAISTVTIVSALTATTTISSNISKVISLLTTSGTVNADVLPTGSGAQTIASDTVTVSTNDSSGYALTLADTDATTTLVSGGNSIAASTGTQTTPIVMTSNTWGYAVQSVGGFNGSGYAGASSAAISGTLKFAGVPATGSPNTLKTTAGTAANDTTTVWYAVAANTTQPSGTYTDSVTYTATTN
jgi:hypothetical protein